METLYFALLITLAVLSAVIFALCICSCCVCLCKKTSRKNKAVVSSIEAVHIKTKKMTNVNVEIGDLNNGGLQYPSSQNYIYYTVASEFEPPLESIDDGDNNKEYDVAMRASEETGTLLLTNTGKIYINTPGGPHAEVMFMKGQSNPQNITTLWIKNTSCANCSKALVEYFKNHHKPTLYVGQIWHLSDRDDDQGLVNLIKAGFKIKVWEKLHNIIHRSNTRTAEYLQRLEAQAK